MDIFSFKKQLAGYFFISVSSLMTGGAIASGSDSDSDNLKHGSMGDLVSRIYHCYQNPDDGPCQLVPESARVNWNAVRNSIPSYNDNIPEFKTVVPDGALCSGGNKEFESLDAISNEWRATIVKSGKINISWLATATHKPSKWYFFLTNDQYDTAKPINWEHLDLIHREKDIEPKDNKYNFSFNLPERKGRQILYVVWQHIEPAGEAFFSCSDIVYLYIPFGV